MASLELPEVETIRRDLERELAGRKVKTVDVRALKSLPRHRVKKSVTDPLEGAKVESVQRRGMLLVVLFDNEHVMGIDLGTHGRLLRAASKDAVDDDTVVTITFTQGGDLRFCDTDGSAELFVVDLETLDEILEERGPIGLDLLEEPITWVDFGRLVIAKAMPLKLLLTDRTIFNGIGDLYSDEILFDAGLRYDRMSNQLSTQEIRRLYRSVVGILHDAIKYRGTTLEDGRYHDLSGQPGEYGAQLAVYERAGELSPRSRTPIQKATFKGHKVFYCTTQV
jgi:formamidopyrimidine-DNA glycosylase